SLSHSAGQWKFGISDADLVGFFELTVAIYIHSIRRRVYNNPRVRWYRVRAVEHRPLIGASPSLANKIYDLFGLFVADGLFDGVVSFLYRSRGGCIFVFFVEFKNRIA